MPTNKLIRVMHLISSLEVGGAEKLLVELMEAARNDKLVHYTVVVMNRNINETLQERLEASGCAYYHLNRPEGQVHPKYLLQLLEIINYRRINVLHVHNRGSKLWGVLCKLLSPQLKLVTTVHSLQAVNRTNAFQYWLHRNVLDMNIAISKVVAAELTQQKISNCKQIYNGIPLHRFKAEQPKPFHSDPAAPLRIVHVGRMNYRVKGQDILIQALKLCKDNGIKFHCRLLAGISADSQGSYQALQQTVQALGLTKEVEFVVNESDVAPFLKEADLFVSPSRSEGMGMAIIEAMTAGLPVISSNIDGPSELITHGINGFLFESENPRSLYEAIRYARENPKAVTKVAHEGLRFAQQFDITAMHQHYTKLYQSLLRGYSLAEVVDHPTVNQPTFGGEALST